MAESNNKLREEAEVSESLDRLIRLLLKIEAEEFGLKSCGRRALQSLNSLAALAYLQVNNLPGQNATELLREFANTRSGIAARLKTLRQYQGLLLTECGLDLQYVACTLPKGRPKIDYKLIALTDDSQDLLVELASLAQPRPKPKIEIPEFIADANVIEFPYQDIAPNGSSEVVDAIVKAVIASLDRVTFDQATIIFTLPPEIIAIVESSGRVTTASVAHVYPPRKIIYVISETDHTGLQFTHRPDCLGCPRTAISRLPIDPLIKPPVVTIEFR